MSGANWQVTRFENAAGFLEHAVGFLSRHEAHNCLPLGIAALVRAHPERHPLPPYMAVAVSGGEVSAAAIMTPPNSLVLAKTEAPAALTAIAADVYAFLPHVPGVTAPVPAGRWFAEAWQVQTGDGIDASMSERIDQWTQVRPRPSVPSAARRANESDRALLRDWLSDFESEAFGRPPLDVDRRLDTILTVAQRGMYLWEVDERAVSMAGFGGPTPRGIRIGPVYTPPELRGRGYASACVARLSQDKLDEGRAFCFLYTDLANPTSNHIYQVVGYEPVCDVVEYRFTRPASPA